MVWNSHDYRSENHLGLRMLGRPARDESSRRRDKELGLGQVYCALNFGLGAKLWSPCLWQTRTNSNQYYLRQWIKPMIYHIYNKSIKFANALMVRCHGHFKIRGARGGHRFNTPSPVRPCLFALARLMFLKVILMIFLDTYFIQYNKETGFWVWTQLDLDPEGPYLLQA